MGEGRPLWAVNRGTFQDLSIVDTRSQELQHAVHYEGSNLDKHVLPRSDGHSYLLCSLQQGHPCLHTPARRWGSISPYQSHHHPPHTVRQSALLGSHLFLAELMLRSACVLCMCKICTRHTHRHQLTLHWVCTMYMYPDAIENRGRHFQATRIFQIEHTCTNICTRDIAMYK